MEKMIKKAAYSLAAMCLAVTLFTACGKKGCTDAYAANYCDECKKDDGSCSFKGRYVIWIKTGDISAGESVNVYMDGVYQGNIAVTFSSSPECGATGALTIEKDLGKSKSKGYTTIYKPLVNGVEDTDSNNWLVRTSNFKANTCVNYQLE